MRQLAPMNQAVAASRARQGFGPGVTDESAIARISKIVADAQRPRPSVSKASVRRSPSAALANLARTA